MDCRVVAVHRAPVIAAGAQRLISAIFHGIFPFTLVPAGWGRGIGRGSADGLKLPCRRSVDAIQKRQTLARLFSRALEGQHKAIPAWAGRLDRFQPVSRSVRRPRSLRALFDIHGPVPRFRVAALAE